MLNTPAACEAMRTGDAHARVARLRRSATAFQNVYAAFAPWQHLSTGIAELDALLNAAGVGSEGSSGGDGGHSHHINAGASGCRAGGLPVGGLHELYGPPLSGKSFLLRRIATTYTRRMTAFRQWCLDEMVRDETWWTMSTADRDEQGKEPQTGEETRHSNAGPSPKVLLKSTSNNAAAAGVPYAPTVAVCDWDLYVCLVRGTTLAPDNPSSATFFSAEVLSWQEQIINALPTPSPVCGCAKGETNGEHGASAVPVPSQQQLQRDYVAGHCHVCVVSTPNELLALLNALLTTENSGQKVSYPPSDGCCTSSSSFTAQQPQQQKPPTTDAADGAPNTTTGKVQRKRSRSSSADKCECTPLPLLLIPSPSSSRVPKRLWDLQKQRLLLVDGLDQLWLHPSFGTHSGTHTGQWFSMELHRLLRCFLTPQCLEAPAVPAEDDSRRRNPLVNCSFSVYSTVVATNGYQGGGFGLHTQQQLQDRLRSFPVIPTQEQKNKGRISSTSLAASAAAVLPRPAGNPVWWMAVDTRCLVEPAHPGLVSLPSSTPSSFRSTSGSHAETQPPSSTSETQRRAARSPRAIVSSLSFGPSREEAEAAVEMHVTVVLGGSRVCAGWVERRDDKEGEGGCSPQHKQRMSIIYVDQLAVRLPSDIRNAFNPSYAFGGASGRSLGLVMGLRDVQSGHILLPMDAEGNIGVTPGQHYAVVILREAQPTVASVTDDEVATAAGNSGEGNAKNRNQQSGKPHQHQQQHQQQPSPVRGAVADAKPRHNPPLPEHHPKDHLSRQERKAARAAAAAAPSSAEPQKAVVAKSVESVPHAVVASPAAGLGQQEKKKRHKTDAREMAPQQQHMQPSQASAEPPHQPRRAPSKTSSPPAVVAAEPRATDDEDSNDVPLVQTYASSLSQPSSRASQSTAAVASSKNSSKRGSPNTKPETATAPPPPMPVRRARSSSTSSRGSSGSSGGDHDRDDEGSTAFSQLYSVHVAAPVVEKAAASKRRRGSPEKKAAKTAVSSTPQQQQQLATTAVTTPKHNPKQQHHKESPDTVPVTLPPSGRGSMMRRVPLDSSSNSDSD